MRKRFDDVSIGDYLYYLDGDKVGNVKVTGISKDMNGNLCVLTEPYHRLAGNIGSFDNCNGFYPDPEGISDVLLDKIQLALGHDWHETTFEYIHQYLGAFPDREPGVMKYIMSCIFPSKVP